jgi:hypothetical protein
MPKELLKSCVLVLKKLLKFYAISAAAMTLLIGLFLAYDSKLWRDYAYQNKEGFYFEKYHTAEEVEEVLNTLYPPGTPLATVVAGLTAAGAWVPLGGDNKSPDIYAYDTKDDSFFFGRPWSVEVWYLDSDQIDQIDQIDVETWIQGIYI